MAITTAEDMDFCSSEEYYENDIHSPTDSSEDSVEVKISPILSKNKRKCAEPRKVQDTFTGPLKKRMCLKVKAEVNEAHPFRPWSPPPAPASAASTTIPSAIVIPKIPVPISASTSDSSPLLPLVVKSEDVKSFSNNSGANFVVPSPSPLVPPAYNLHDTSVPVSCYFRPPSPIHFYQTQTEPVALVKKLVKVKEELDDAPRVPIHPQIASLSTIETERMILNSTETFPALQQAGSSGSSKKSESVRREQRNYKNMTRERRIEANARERTRVHTISAAFDTLRKSIPSYSNVQKLSKLSVLRIACSYIMTLSNIVDENDSATAECVDLVSRTIQREGKLRKKKDDND